MMNKYDEFYKFRQANLDDVDHIMSFLKMHWGEDHILSNNRDFFIYHYGSFDNGINMYLMIDKENDEIVGTVGYVVYSTDPSRRYFSGSISVVSPNLKIPQGGLEIMKRLHDYLSPATELSCGSNPRTIVPLFKRYFGYTTGVLKQYYLVNSYIDNFNIITCGDKEVTKSEKDAKDAYLVRLYDIEESGYDFNLDSPRLPYRDKEYIHKRYFKHPIYEYLLYDVVYEEQTVGITVLRHVEYNNSKTTFFVDYIGDTKYIAFIGQDLREILVNDNSECLNLLEEGIEDEVLRQAGFASVDDKEEVIIPSYFDPFVNENVKIYFVKEKDDLIVLKGYGDQDNPKYG